jgi:hypothetical protein
MENYLTQTTGNISYVTGTPDPTVFRLGMTQAGRSPYERWNKDGDYAKLDYAMADQVHEFFELGDKLDHDVFRVLLLRNPDIIRLKDVADVRSPEIFKCDQGWDYFLAAAKYAIAEVTGSAKPIRFKLSTRPYQYSFVEQFKATRGDFCLFAKCRSGKSVMTLLAATESGYQSVVVVSYRASASNSWREDARRYTMFHEWDVIDLASPTWEDEIAESKTSGRRQLMVSTVQRQREEFGYIKKLAAQYVKGVDLLALDECHVGGESNGFQLLKKNLKYGRLLEISGTAYKTIWKYPKERVFVWGYVEEQRAKIEGHEWAQSLPRMELTLAKFNAGELGSVYGDDPDALKNVFSAENGKWKDSGSVQSFLRKYFAYGKVNKKLKMLHDSQHIVMTLPSKDACHLFAESLREFGSPYIPLVVTSDTGNNQEAILRHVRVNESTITLTRWANVLGVTVPQWDTVIHGCEYDSAEFWVQFTFRGGSTKRDSWKVIDLAPERGIQSVLDMASATSAATGEENASSVLRSLVDFADVFEFNDGYRKLDYETILSQSVGNVASAKAESRAAMAEVTIGSNLEVVAAAFEGKDRVKPETLLSQVVNSNGTASGGNVQITRSGDPNSESAVRKAALSAIKAAIGKLDDVVADGLLFDDHLSTLPQVLSYEMFEAHTGCSQDLFKFVIESGWVNPCSLNSRISRIHMSLSAALQGAL